MNDLMEEQKNEIERAIINAGEYRVRKGYSNLAVETLGWFKMSREQRQRKIDRFMKAAIKGNSDRPSASSLLDSPFQLKESMMMKANDLANDKTVIVQAPGDECTWMVRKCPHYIKASKSSISCDEQCLSYKSTLVH